MDNVFFDQLLYEEESTTLDFKKQQYRFAKATDDEKSELLKDILGFANAWRRSHAYILIGVEEVRGGRSNVIGIAEHLHDHALQQFVNNLTNRPLQFHYEAFGFEGKQVGIIRIDQQPRPVYLKREYGKLQPEKVYVRRGSSTDPTKPASPEEIALMGQSFFPEQADLNVEFAEVDQDISLGQSISLDAELCEMPPKDSIPKFGDADAPGLLGAISAIRNIEYNHRYWVQLANYESARRLFRPVRFVTHNCGRVAANAVRIELSTPVDEGIGVFAPADLPNQPRQTRDLYHVPGLPAIHPVQRHVGSISISKDQQRILIDADCSDLQPGRKVWSDSFYIAKRNTGEIVFKGRVYAGNLQRPKEFSLSVRVNVARTKMSVDDLLAIEEPDREG